MEEAAKLKEAEVRQAVEVLSVEGVAQSISALSMQISKALAEVSDNLIAEVQRLAMIRQAVALERAELERLHKIDIAATALDRLVQDHGSKSQALEAEMSARRAAWDAELKAHERAEKEYDENLKKQRQRETEEYEYKKTIDRKKTQENTTRRCARSRRGTEKSRRHSRRVGRSGKGQTKNAKKNSSGSSRRSAASHPGFRLKRSGQRARRHTRPSSGSNSRFC